MQLPTLITRNESQAIKGLLMLLIVMGHLRGINSTFQSFLYCFHVQAFFILSVCYPIKTLTITKILNQGIKLLYPFWLFYTGLIIINVTILHESAFCNNHDIIPHINNTLLGMWSYITGGIHLINEFCGVQFLWFLPCFFSMTIIRMWIHRRKFSKGMINLFYLIGGITFCIYSVLWGAHFISRKFVLISEALSPFSVWQGLGYLTLGTVCVTIILRNFLKNSILPWIGVVLCSIIFILFYQNQIVFRLLRGVFPIVFFLAIYYSRKYIEKISILRCIGNFSFAIYMIHPLVCILIELIVPRKILDGFFALCVEFVIVLLISYIFASVINRIVFLRRVLFPRGEDFGLIKSKIA